MGRVWASTAIFLSVVCFLIFNMNKITGISDSVIQALNECSNLVMTDNFTEAYERFSAAQDNFISNEKYLCATLTHRELDEIIVEFGMAEASLVMADKESLLPMIKSIERRLEHIKDMEEISVKNIF